MNPATLLPVYESRSDHARRSGVRTSARRCRTILALLALGLCLFAAVARSAPSPAPTPVVVLRCLFLDETGGDYSLKTGDGYRELGSAPYYVGAPVTVAGSERLELFKELADAESKDGKLKRTKIAILAPPAGATSVLVVVTSIPSVDPRTGPTYDIAYYDSSPALFPLNSIRIVNLGQGPLATKFGSLETITGPGASRIVRPEIGERNLVRTKAAVQASGGWQLLYDSRTIIRPKQRVTVLCVYSASGLKQSYDPEALARFGTPPPAHFWLTYTDTI